MQYVSVAPDRKTSLDRQVFDYEIPAEFLIDIKIGQLVLIPFHGRDIFGVVIDLKKQSQVKAKLKPLKKIITNFPILLPWQIKLANWMSSEYFCPLGKALFSLLPPLTHPTCKILPNLPPYLPPWRWKIGENKNFLVQGPLEYRLRVYQKIIEKIERQGRQVLLLFPEIPNNEILNYFHQYSPLVYHSQMKNSERFRVYTEILDQKHNLILGSQSALFSPLNNLGAIIIDQPEGESFKSDRQPYVVSRTVAQKISRLTGSNLIIGEETPSLETHYQKLKVIAQAKTKKTPITIIDLNNQKSAISLRLEEAIGRSKKAIIFCDRKGEGRAGWTTRSVAKILNNMFPAKKILCLDKDNIFNPAKAVFDVLVASHKIFDFPPPAGGFDLVAIQSLDRTLSLPYFDVEEQAFRILIKLKNLAGKELIIQTFEPERKIFHQLNAPEKFFAATLTEKRENQFPPFYRLIKLSPRQPNVHRVSVHFSPREPVVHRVSVQRVVDEIKKEFPGLSVFEVENKIIIKVPRHFNLQKLLPYFTELDRDFKINVDAREV